MRLSLLMLPLLATILPALSFQASAKMLDPNVPADALEIMKRGQCGEADGKPAVYSWSGNVYSRVRGEPDRLLFKGQGMNIRQCVSVNDPVQGKGFRQVSREIMLYLDPKTGEVVRHWDNPWTGERVEVMQVANDPVNQPAQYTFSKDGDPAVPKIKQEGQWLLQSLEIPLFYPNPLGGKYQEFIGGQYHAMEIFDFTFNANEIRNTDIKAVYPAVSWVRLSDWMPWMKMRDRQGQLVFNMTGRKLASFDELPQVMKNEIAKNYPEYTRPPALDDNRPNETTWTAFKQWIDAKQTKADSTSTKLSTAPTNQSLSQPSNKISRAPQ
ncbi:MAG: DUF1838 family protein [Psychrobacter sp.]|nr:DUF1838 family protein [Psychrobacter sp.]